MNKREYLKLALSMDAKWLRYCLSNPSEHMSNVHCAIIKIALRKKGELQPTKEIRQ